jgi:hypothetical protein
MGLKPRDRAAEERHLAAANWHIAKGEQWVARQQKLIERLSAGGRDTTDAERQLSNFDDLLNSAREHRRLILHRLEEA